jgi:hypothetical protein
MKKILISLALILTTGGSLALLAGCASTKIKCLTGDEFVKHAEACEYAGSFSWNTYIGVSSQNVYLESGHPAFIGKGIQTTVYWTPLSELPEELSKQLKNKNPPWTNWNENIANKK